MNDDHDDEGPMLMIGMALLGLSGALVGFIAGAFVGYWLGHA